MENLIILKDKYLDASIIMIYYAALIMCCSRDRSFENLVAKEAKQSRNAEW